MNEPCDLVNAAESTAERRTGVAGIETYPQRMDMSYSHVNKAVSDADVEATRDAARGKVLGELDGLYRHCASMLGSVEEGNADVRYAELSVRILDRLIKLYRLDSKAAVQEPDDEDVAAATARTMSQVRAQIAQLAARTEVVEFEPADVTEGHEAS